MLSMPSAAMARCGDHGWPLAGSRAAIHSIRAGSIPFRDRMT